MKRIYAAIAFLLVIVSTSLFTIKQCYDFRSRALPQLEQLSAYAQNQQLDQAAEVAAQFFDQWSQTKDSMVWYIRHEPLRKNHRYFCTSGAACPIRRPFTATGADQRADHSGR